MESNLNTNPVAITTLKDAIAAIVLLQSTVEGLSKVVADLTAPKNTDVKEMTDDHARQILTGDLKDKKHGDAAKTLGLSYGQVYSCRGQYTFKHIHKELTAKGFKNPWVKA
jgi:hypothetical protein